MSESATNRVAYPEPPYIFNSPQRKGEPHYSDDKKFMRWVNSLTIEQKIAAFKGGVFPWSLLPESHKHLE